MQFVGCQGPIDVFIHCDITPSILWNTLSLNHILTLEDPELPIMSRHEDYNLELRTVSLDRFMQGGKGCNSQPRTLSLDSGKQVIESLKEKLLQAGKRNQKLSDVTGYTPGMLSHDDTLDEGLNLKLLHVAAWTGDLLTIEYLKTLRDATATTTGDFTPLHLAASRGHTEALKVLLELPNVDVGACSLEGFTALHLAAYGGHHDCIQVLLERCSSDHNVNARDKVMERTALHWAVGHTSSRKVFDLLLEIPEINVCPKDRAGFTPLHFATMSNDDRQLMETLLDRNPAQVNDKVGDVRWFLLDSDVRDFDSRPWRELSGIKMVHPGWGQDGLGTNGRQFERLDRLMSGYTALHFAACQDNAEVVSHLLSLPEIKANEQDMEHGMTPLHCSLLCGSMNAFDTLMSFEGVDVNSQVVHGGAAKHHWMLLQRPRSDFFAASIEYGFDVFESLETPLHFGIRFCPSDRSLWMMIKFCNHPKFNPTTCNEEGILSLQLAWARSYLEHVAESERSSKLQDALDIFEGHPGNAFLMSIVSDQEKAFQDIMTTVLVSATLVAGLTFSSFLQPPFGADARNLSNVTKRAKEFVRYFTASATVSFYLAIAAICCSLVSFLVRPAQKSHRLPIHYVLRASFENLSVLTLLSSVVYGAIAFLMAGFMNMPPYTRLYMILGTIFGIIIMCFMAFSSAVASEVSGFQNYKRNSVYRYSIALVGKTLPVDAVVGAYSIVFIVFCCYMPFLLAFL